MTIWTDMAGLEFRQSYYDAQGIRTRVIEAGSGQPLILLHGAGGHAEAYAKNMVEHAKHFHVYSVDMVGHGYTDTPDLSYDMMDFVNHVRSFMDAIGVKGAYISGESLGATVGSWLAITSPEYVAKLVLNTGIMMPISSSGRAQLSDALARTNAAVSEMTREMVRKRIEWLMHDQASATDEIIEVRYQIYAQPGMAEITRRIANSLLGGLITDEWNARWHNPEQMRKIKCPVLIVWTHHNPGQSVELAAEGAKYISDVKMVVLEHSAHWPQWEEPERFNRIHVDFLLGKQLDAADLYPITA